MRRLRRWIPAVLALLGLGVIALLADGWLAFGQTALGPRRSVVESSPEWDGSRFVNPQPLYNDAWGALWGAIKTSPNVSPSGPVPTATVGPSRFQGGPASGLRVTWLGHSTSLIELEGVRVLSDPVWSDRASPYDWVGPRRWFTPPLALESLPKLDAVVISHDHYDHLDHRTIIALKDRVPLFLVPLGVGAHLAYWGVAPERIRELDWWDRTQVGGVEIVCTPARHASGRLGLDQDRQLWAGWALLGSSHRVYYSGDTGLFPALREIGERLGPFDLTMIEVGQYGSAWPDWHLGPEQAVLAHQWVRGRLLLPVHWGTFQLAYHGWTEPIERTLAAAATASVSVVVPRPGQSVEPSAPPTLVRWWPEIPWKTGLEDPIRATLVP